MKKVPAKLFGSIYDTEGTFGIRLYTLTNWSLEHCREMLALYHLNKAMVGEDFFFITKNPGNVVKFIHTIESKLPVSGKTEFSATDSPPMIYVNPNEFWYPEHRHSLFTILLRIGKNYNPQKNNWRKVLKTSSYLKTTQPAIRQFFSGHIDLSDDYKYHFNGWVSEFSYRTAKQIRTKLIKREA